MRFLFQSNLNSSDEEINVNTMTKGLNDEGNVDVSIEFDNVNDEKSNSGKFWDSTPKLNHSFTTLSSSATMSTLQHFGLSNHPGKGKDDVTIDAFMDLSNEPSKSKETIKSSQLLKPMDVDPTKSSIHNTALSCIAKRDYDQFMSIIEMNPEILLYKCKRKGSSERTHMNGCNGGTILHVLVSQKPSLKKKRVKKQHSMKNRLTNALTFATNVDYEIHIMPSVPDSVLTFVIDKHPEACQIIDDYGRLPLHCATLSQSMHFDEVRRLQRNNDQGRDSFPKLRIIVREINVVDLLLQSNRKGARSADARGNLPIHYAMSIGSTYFDSCDIRFHKNKKYKKPSSLETVTLLLGAYPKSTEIQNKEGDLPIHVLCSMGADLNTSTLEKVLSYQSSCKHILTAKNGDGDSPLFVAVKSRANLEVIRCFASIEKNESESPSLFAQRDAYNNNILHVALQFSSRIDHDIIRTIIAVAPSTTSIPDSKGVMPIR
jgi:ankyrin repeat protein